MEKILRDFNNKEVDAFSTIYSLMYRELNLYAKSLFRGVGVGSEDIVHDVFVKLWGSKKQFNSIKGIKAYLYISIKNSFLNQLDHTQIAEKYSKSTTTTSNGELEIIENEFFSLIDYSLGLLPDNLAAILQLFLEGYSPSEISERLGKPIQTVYNRKNEAIKILKKKIPMDKLLIISALLKI